MSRIVLCIPLFIVFFASPTFAHGDLDERILNVTKELEKAPDSAYLYFKRGKLYYQHEEYNKSIKDIKKSSKFGYQSVEQNLLFSKNYFRTNKYKKALTFVNSILADDPYSVIAIRLKAQINFKLSNFELAANAYEEVLKYTSKTFPENYIEAASAWKELGTDDGYQKAIKVISLGLNELGELVSLYDYLINLHIDQGNIPNAIETQKKVVLLAKRKERAYFELSKLHLLNTDQEQALTALNLAKDHFNQLNPRIQNTSFMRELLKNINNQYTILKPNN